MPPDPGRRFLTRLQLRRNLARLPMWSWMEPHPRTEPAGQTWSPGALAGGFLWSGRTAEKWTYRDCSQSSGRRVMSAVLMTANDPKLPTSERLSRYTTEAFYLALSTEAVAAMALCTSCTVVRQLTTLTRMACRPFQFVPEKKASPVALIRFITSSV